MSMQTLVSTDQRARLPPLYSPPLSISTMAVHCTYAVKARGCLRHQWYFTIKCSALLVKHCLKGAPVEGKRSLIYKSFWLTIYACSQICDLQKCFIDRKGAIANIFAAQRDKMTRIDLQQLDSIVDRPTNYPSWCRNFCLSKRKSLLKAIFCPTPA